MFFLLCSPLGQACQLLQHQESTVLVHHSLPKFISVGSLIWRDLVGHK
ncbi:hypothetical protein BL107_12280 [Synechococcus sp. BL107]|nr:hypothetical protein BL107_12280 [Synechococcus sp. BL107]